MGAAWMCATKAFDTVTLNFMMVGHTHSRLDQRFSIIAASLARAKKLETLVDFADYLQRTTRHPHLKSEIVVSKGAYDWQQFFASLGVNVSGLVATQKDPVAAHSWRFVRRAHLDKYVPNAEVEIPAATASGQRGCALTG